MLNDIVDGVSVKLNSLFGNSHEIYTKDVEQGLNEPCFFIKCISTTQKPLLGKRKQRTYSLVISYFTDQDNDRLMEVSDILMDGLEYITLLSGEVVRGWELTPEIVDGVLHFSVKYHVFLNDLGREVPMEELSSGVGVKGA